MVEIGPLTKIVGGRIPVKVYGDLPKSFVDELTTGISQFPPRVLNKIRKTNLDEIRIASKHSDAFPENPIVQDYFRRTSDSIGSNGSAGQITGDGNNFLTLTQGGKVTNDIGILNQMFDHQTAEYLSKAKAFGEPADRSVVSHELGHKTDDLFKNHIGISMSATESFKEAVNSDLRTLTEKLKNDTKNFNRKLKKNKQLITKSIISKGTSNKPSELELQELFADCIAANTTGTQSEVQGKESIIEFFFPESYKYVRKYLYLMGMK